MANDEIQALIERVTLLHQAKGFESNGGEEPFFRMALLMEEIGEVCRCLTTDRGDLAEEHADVLIVLLGNAVSFRFDIIGAAHRKLDQLEKLDPRPSNGHARLVSKDGSR